jgi:hypothetical protein
VAPTDFDYLATRNDIIQRAFRIVGALEPGQTLSGEMLNQGVEALQQLIKSWSNKHLFLWSFNEETFSTVNGTVKYDATLDQEIIGLDKAWVLDSSDDIQIEVISWSRYMDITDKAATGRPTVIAYKPTPAPSLYLWPVPDAAYSVKLLAIYPLKDFDEAATSGDVPARFQKALTYCLAEDLFDEYPGPMNERQYVAGKAADLFREAKNSDMDVETTDEVEGLFTSSRRCY